MKRYSVHQMLPPARPDLMRRLLPQIERAGAHVVLDLEDGVQDPLHPERNTALKREARENLASLFDRPGLPADVSVRINGRGTPDFEADLETLERPRDAVSWPWILVPKIESEDDVRWIHDTLRSRGIRFGEIVPTIETTAGVRDLAEILKSGPGVLFRTVQFGHYDYNLDAGNWPFLDQRSAAFWELVSSLVAEIESRGFHYSHTPYGELSDDSTLRAIVGRLGAGCSRRFSIVTLNLRQSRVCAEDPRGESGGAWISRRIPTGTERDRLARTTVETYRNQRCGGRSFSLERRTRRFIAPHEYAAALRHLGDTSRAPPRSLDLAFLGGCLAAQKGLGYSKLFHRVLRRRCRAELGLELRVALGDYFRFDECREAARRLLAERPHLLVFSLRPQPYLALCRLVIKRIADEGHVVTTLHPALLQRDLRQWPYARGRHADRDLPVRPARLRRGSLSLRDVNLLGGWLVGLNAWATRHALETLRQVQDSCRCCGVPLIVLGVPASPQALVGSLHCGRFRRQAIRFCRDTGITHLDCFSTRGADGTYLFEEDGIHFNAHGHRFVADRLFGVVSGFSAGEARQHPAAVAAAGNAVMD